jgi:hypothetical protein
MASAMVVPLLLLKTTAAYAQNSESYIAFQGAQYIA